VALKGLPALDKDIEALSIQLYNMFSFRTSIKLFTNSSDGEENMNLPMLEELASKTLVRKVAQLKRVCKIKDNFQLKLKRKKIQIELNVLRWNLDKWVFAIHKWQ
jgi:hypothetical protein